MSDPVNNPSHYKLGNGMEVIDVIRAMLTPEEFRGYCKGNTIKYMGRDGRKDDPAQEAGKAAKYAEWWAESYDQAPADPGTIKYSAAEATKLTNIVFVDAENDQWSHTSSGWVMGGVYATATSNLPERYEPYRPLRKAGDA